MESVSKNARHLNRGALFIRDGALVSKDHVVEQLSNLIDWLEETKKSSISVPFSAEKAEMFWQSLFHRVQDCSNDCQQLRCY